MIVMDTNVMIAVWQKKPAITQWLNTLGNEELIVPIIVVMELTVGCRNKQELTELQQLIRGRRIHWPTVDDCKRAWSYLIEYHSSSGMGIPDALIAACAVGLRAPLCTLDKDFNAVPNLKIKPPYALP